MSILMPRLIAVVVLIATSTLGGAPLTGACSVREERRVVAGAERTVVMLANDRIEVELVPEMAGTITRYALVGATQTPFEFLDDCPYHYACRWEGKAFTHAVVDAGPARASVTVRGGGTIAPSHLRLAGIAVTNPLALEVERTVSLEPGSTRLRIDVRITNVGDGIAPSFRYMVHAVFGGAFDRARTTWFLPTASTIEVFDTARGSADMGASAGGAPIDHPFSRFIAGRKADKPRYEAGGWGALMTAVGPAYLLYQPDQFDFMQYWFGGDSSWHYCFEPQTRPVDLRPGEATACSFTLALDGADAGFAAAPVAWRSSPPPDAVAPGATVTLVARAATAVDQRVPVRAIFRLDGAGEPVAAEGIAEPFAFGDVAGTFTVPADAVNGERAWSATLPDGRVIGSGTLLVAPAAEVERRRIAAATAAADAALAQALAGREDDRRRVGETRRLWLDGADLAWSLDDQRRWPDDARGHALSFTRVPAAVSVLGDWRAHADLRIVALAAEPAMALPAEWSSRGLGDDRARVRAAAPCAGGIAVLVIDATTRRAEVLILADGAVVSRFGRFADQPGEGDDTIGGGARALAVDADGSIWIGTDAWGPTSVFRLNQDNAPYEEASIGVKGALKKFSRDGRLLAAVGLLAPPSDVVLARADGLPVVLAPYRHVSSYHGAQVREGVLIARRDDARRVAELKVPAGSLAIDGEGRLWTADIAGHVRVSTLRGRRIADAAATPAQAVPDATLANDGPLPGVIRMGADGRPRLLQPLARRLLVLAADATVAATHVLPDHVGPAPSLIGDVIVGGDPPWSP